MRSFDALAAFCAVCDEGGFAPAARRLKLSPSGVTRVIARLEQHLGTRLLHRTTRSLRLTDAGERYLERARAILAQVEEAEEAARGDGARPRGRLVVGAPVIFGRLHVAPLVARFLALHAEVSAELRLSDRNAHLVEEGVDLAVRIGTLDDSTLVARRLGRTGRVAVASPAYLAARGRPEHPRDLGSHDLVSFMPGQAGGDWTFAAGDGRAEIRVAVRPRFATNSGDAAIDVARAGGGITLALGYQVVDHLASGALCRVLQPFEPAPAPIHALYPSARLLPARVRAFLDLAVETARWEFGPAP